MSDALKPYYVTGIVMAASVDDATAVIGEVLPFVERTREEAAAAGLGEDWEEPILLSVVPLDDDSDEEARYLVEDREPYELHYLALVHMTGQTEEDVEREVSAGLGGSVDFQGVLACAEFDPESLDAEIDSALQEIKREAKDELNNEFGTDYPNE